MSDVGPLVGVRVLDLTNAVAGASATKVLTDLGADVIKVETPGRGDFLRHKLPYLFEAFNRNKRSVAIDLREPAGQGVVLRLAHTSDVLVQSMRPGAAERFGLGRDSVVSVRPSIIYASLSAFGPAAANRPRRGVDALVQAESGLAALQGGVLGHTSTVDIAAGLALAQAVVVAILQRERTGTIVHPEVNLLATARYLQTGALAQFSATGVMPTHATIAQRQPTAGRFETADGPLFMPYWEPNWSAYCEVLGCPDLVYDSRFRTPVDRQANGGELRAILQPVFANRSRGEWIRELEDRGIMAGAYREYSEVVEDFDLEPGVVADGTTARFASVPFGFAGVARRSAIPAPLVGADTSIVLTELGLANDEIDVLSERGVVGLG